MDLAYFIENTGENYIDNSGLFNVIRDLYIDENEVYSDIEGNRKELEKLLEVIDYGDRLVVRSMVDLADTAKGLLYILYDLQGKGVELYSLKEPNLSGNEYNIAFNEFIDMTKYYTALNRKKGYKEAYKAGKVGRPTKTKEIEQAIKLYKTRAFTIAEIEDLTKISKSTLYRYLKDIDRDE